MYEQTKATIAIMDKNVYKFWYNPLAVRDATNFYVKDVLQADFLKDAKGEYTPEQYQQMSYKEIRQLAGYEQPLWVTILKCVFAPMGWLKKLRAYY